MSLTDCSTFEKYVQPTVKNCTFMYNYALYDGGAIYNSGSAADATITNCVFQYNQADRNGAAVANIFSSPAIDKCAFIENDAANIGGGICNLWIPAHPTISNCVFYDNSAQGGGAIYDFYCYNSAVNCTFHNNMSASFGETIFSAYAPWPQYVNSIMWGDSSRQQIYIYDTDYPPSITYSDVKGYSGDATDKNIDPQFVNPSDVEGFDNIIGTIDDGLELATGSHCIDAGSNSIPTSILNGEDITGTNREIGTTVDMGAYEFQPNQPNMHPKLSGGFEHTMLLALDGTVWACGDNYSDDCLGCNTKNTFGSLTSPPAAIAVVDWFMPVNKDSSGNYLNNIIDISAGAYYSLALDNGGNVWAWGHDEYGEIGDNGSSCHSNPSSCVVRTYPVQVVQASSPLPNITKISAGRDAGVPYSLACDKSGNVWAWGNNSFGQLGNGGSTADSSPHPFATQVVDLPPSGTTIVDVKAGSSTSMALDSAGHVWTWGDNTWGTLGDGKCANSSCVSYEDPNPVTTPVEVLCGAQSGTDTHLHNITDIAISGYGTCYARDSGGHVWSWGYNQYGELGNGTSGDSVATTPVQVSFSSPVPTIVAVAAGDDFALALDNQGCVWAWGATEGYGPLGNGSTNCSDSSTPVQVMVADGGVLSNIVGISAGYRASLGVDKYGNLWGWGGIAGQTGIWPWWFSCGTTNYARLIPSDVPSNVDADDAIPLELDTTTNPPTAAVYQGSTVLVLPNAQLTNLYGDVWFSFIPPVAQMPVPSGRAYYDIGLCGSDFYTYLELFTFSQLTTPLATNSSVAGCSGPAPRNRPNSKLTLKLTTGDKYLIDVTGVVPSGSGYSYPPYTNRGSYNLTVTEDTSKPVYDECGDALVIYANTLTPYSGSTVGTPSGSGSAWFSYTPTTSGSATISLCGSGTNWNTELYLYQGSCSNPVASNSYGCSNNAQIIYSVTAGTTYYIKVFGVNGATGSYELEVTQ